MKIFVDTTDLDENFFLGSSCKATKNEVKENFHLYIGFHATKYLLSNYPPLFSPREKGYFKKMESSFS